jgi:hypothetical protein
MAIDIEAALRVMAACDAQIAAQPPLVSFVVPKKGGGRGQIFLEWVRGRMLKDYLLDPRMQGVMSLYTATYCRKVDQRNLKRRLMSELQPGDEIRFIPVRQ